MKFSLNKDLKESIKTNKLIISITTDEYQKINKLIDTLKVKYKQELEIIKDKYKNFKKIKEHNLLVKNIIHEVIDNFDIIKKYNVCIFLTGSFARYTNKINSDLDLHFSYNNKYKNTLFKYEEIIYYILLSIFNLNRSKIHNMILSKIDKDNIDKIDNILDNNDLEIILTDNINSIKYTINGNIKRRIYLQYGNDKDLKTIYKYLEKEILSFNREWAHVFYIFTNQKEFSKYYHKLLKIEKLNNNYNKLETRTNNIKYQIKQINNLLNNTNKESICEFKKIFQMEEFKLLYEYISYKRDLYLLENDDWYYINLDNNDKYLKSDNIFKDIKIYLYTLFTTVEPLKNNYSIHQDGYIESKYFNKLEKELLKINKQIEGELWKD